MAAGLWNLLFFVVALGILVTVHEAGHFLAARRCGVKVERFSIGFGSVLFRHTGKDGCEYAISAIPLGGYVKMLGENETDGDTKLDPRSFKAQSLKKRAIIIAAGPFFNIVLAFLLYILINMLGVSALRPYVGDVIPGSAADRAGLMADDAIVSINGRAVQDWTDVTMSLVEGLDSSVLSMQVASDLGKGEQRQVSLDLRDVVLQGQQDPLLTAGIHIMQGKVSNVVASVNPGSPAYQAGLDAGDAIVAINGQDTPTWYRVQDTISRSAGLLNLTIKRGDELYTAQVLPEQIYDEATKKTRNIIGVTTTIEPVDGLIFKRSYGPVDAVIKAGSDTARMSLFIVNSVYKLLSGAISADNLSGPISIAKGAGQSAALGFVFFLSFLAAVSVNLGILNLIPIHVLDGGQLLFIAWEGVTGKEPGARTQLVLSAAGFCLIIALSLLAVLNDVRAL